MEHQFDEQHVIGVPVISAEVSYPIRFEMGSNKSFVAQPDSAQMSNKLRKSWVLHKLRKKANRIREHVSLSPKISDTVKGKLSLGARILQVGGMEKVFRNLFNVCEQERLLKASQCYLSTTSGPIAGILFISTRNIAFCSERSLKVSCPSGETIRVHYKVLIPLAKVETANQSENLKRPSQKYIQIVTVDNFDFWFMGFLNYHKSWKALQQAIFC